MYTIHCLDNISAKGLARLPKSHFRLVDDINAADALLLRSTKLHDRVLPERIRAVARAGVGTDNIPVATLSQKGVPVFFAPGANANAVKELVLAAMLMGYRRLDQARSFLSTLTTDHEDTLHQQVEKGKQQFAGQEISGKTLAVLGLGNIGVKVANAALHLGMRVIAYDPAMRLENALALLPGVQKIDNLTSIYAQADVLSLHIPLMESTKELINAQSCSELKPGCLLLNFSRAGIVSEAAILDALNQQHLRAYITDFPTVALQGHPDVLTFPHLGASTQEAEDNCARMVCDNLRAFLLNGKISQSVNFPDIDLPPADPQKSQRFFIANTNKPGMIAHLSQAISTAGYNIEQMINQSQGTTACNLIDIANPDDRQEDILLQLQSVEGVLRVLPVHSNANWQINE